MPGAWQDIKWGKDLCYMVGDKMFAVTGTEPPFTICVKVLPEEFEELCERAGIVKAPYIGRFKWIVAEDVNAFTHDQWKHYIKQSYDLIYNKLNIKQKDENQGNI